MYLVYVVGLRDEKENSTRDTDNNVLSTGVSTAADNVVTINSSIGDSYSSIVGIEDSMGDSDCNNNTGYIH